MYRNLMFAPLVLVAALAASAQQSPLVGKPLPELALSHALQGEAWSPAQLRGSVVVLDVFQLG